MSRKTLWVIAAVVGLAVVGVGAFGAWMVFGLVTPEEAVAAVTEKLGRVDTYRFEMLGTIKSQGQEIELDFKGVAADAAVPAETKLSMDGDMTLMGQRLGMAEILLDGKLYLQYDPNPLGTPGQWYVMDLDLSGMQMAQGGGNPSEYLQYMKAYSTVEQLDDVNINGVDCAHYFLTIDTAKLTDMAVSNYTALAEQMPAGAAGFDEETLRAMYEGATMTTDIYISKDDGMPRRQELWMEFAGDLDMTMEVTLDLFDFDKPVEITAPDGAVPLPEVDTGE